jgi:hypothetical protein
MGDDIMPAAGAVLALALACWLALAAEPTCTSRAPDSWADKRAISPILSVIYECRR